MQAKSSPILNETDLKTKHLLRGILAIQRIQESVIKGDSPFTKIRKGKIFYFKKLLLDKEITYLKKIRVPAEIQKPQYHAQNKLILSSLLSDSLQLSPFKICQFEFVHVEVFSCLFWQLLLNIIVSRNVKMIALLR